MPSRRVVFAGAALALLVLIIPADVAPQQSAMSYRIDPIQSAIYVVTHRAGLLSFLGHDHAILATEWSGALCWNQDGTGTGHGTIEVAAGSLVIDTDTARAVAGLGGGPSPGQVRELQVRFLDTDHLDAERYPTLALNVTRLTASTVSGMLAEGQLRIRDHVRDVEYPVEIVRSSESVRFTGILQVAQSSIGIRPESVAAVVKVADVVDIHFDLLGVPTGVTCSTEISAVPSAESPGPSGWPVTAPGYVSGLLDWLAKR
jgi:polyisoprenoid-binding protein YceI